ncbi:MAG: tRNA (adenosine(37)-N6)-threonylcarbamoyltransferase complex transferase subunit TsaD [Neisseriales bacterium]|nr:MAG: tRNA (adenosine(37)-N6)-threonylcarbamoyltransferase complex transferase subunit TsaD [Neisseriales bacterium]
MLVLGIETSCDETGVALYDDKAQHLVQVLHTQTALHARYGGVVPEIASRDHIRHIVPLIKTCLNNSHQTLSSIDAIAYTAGPGLSGALLVGASVAESLAFALNIPVIPVNHLEGHLLAALYPSHAIAFPFLTLLVSGGHTQFFKAKAIGEYQLIGETLDDAAGEAFDKVAKLLGLPYPGAKQLSALAKLGDPNRFRLPRPLGKRHDLMMSFSGLKTAMVHLVNAQQQPIDETTKHDLCAAFQAAMVDVLVNKIGLGLSIYQMKRLVVAGGVSLNEQLRKALAVQAENNNWQIAYPPIELCADNGAMIAFAGALNQQYIKLAGRFAVYPRWVLGQPLPAVFR